MTLKKKELKQYLKKLKKEVGKTLLKDKQKKEDIKNLDAQYEKYDREDEKNMRREDKERKEKRKSLKEKNEALRKEIIQVLGPITWGKYSIDYYAEEYKINIQPRSHAPAWSSEDYIIRYEDFSTQDLKIDTDNLSVLKEKLKERFRTLDWQ